MVIDTFESRQLVLQGSNQLGREILIEKDTHFLSRTVGPISHVGRECIHGCEVLFLKAGMLIQNLFLGHAVRQPAENIIHRDPHPANARLSVALIRFNGNSRVCSRHGNLIISHHSPPALPATVRT